MLEERMKQSISRRVFLGAAVAGVALGREALAQNSAENASEPDAKFSTDVKVVNVLATVRDKQGKIVSDLAKDDFDLAEDGRPQTIRYFARETDLPLTLGLLVDTSMSQRLVLGQERDASLRSRTPPDALSVQLHDSYGSLRQHACKCER